MLNKKLKTFLVVMTFIISFVLLVIATHFLGETLSLCLEAVAGVLGIIAEVVKKGK